MRPIKFRAWVHWAKKMAVVGSVYWNSKGEIVRVEAGESSDWLKDGWYDIDKANIQLMQFTGLKDKNGKEIYEGDILASDWYYDHGQWGETLKASPEVVTWHNGTACFGPFSAWYSDQLASCEVIGNIYENPELLEAKS